jgi:hypothetical protein
MAHARFNLAPLVFAAACTLGATATDAATVAHYKFDSGTADTKARGRGTILDSSDDGLDGSPYGGPVYKAVGNPDSTLALRFDGTNARVFVQDHPLLALTRSLTIEAYLYLKDDADEGIIVVRSDTRDLHAPYLLYLTPESYLHFSIYGDHCGTYEFGRNFALPHHQWLHVAATLDDASGWATLYVNGALWVNAVMPCRPAEKLDAAYNPGLGIGGSIVGSQSQRFFRGKIDEVRISDVALDPSDFLPPP